MTGFTDIHAHLIYGVDDGARTRSDMEAMIDAAYADGIVSLFATPHITFGVHAFDEEGFLARLDEANRYCRARKYEMTIYPGAEIMYTPAMQQYADVRKLPSLDDSDFILMEFIPNISIKEMEAALDQMERFGYTTIIAHVERYDCLYHWNHAREIKRKFDVRFQVNASTLIHPQSYLKNRRVHSWIQNELVDFVASDAHNLKHRPFRMSRAYECLKEEFGKDIADQLTGLS